MKTVLGRAGKALVESFLKSFGSEAGKKPFAKGSCESNGMVNINTLRGTGIALDTLTKQYSWENAEKNISGLSGILKKVAPIVGAGMLSYYFVPVVISGVVYGLAESIAGSMAYTATNFGVVTTGLYVAGKKLAAPEEKDDLSGKHEGRITKWKSKFQVEAILGRNQYRKEWERGDEA